MEGEFPRHELFAPFDKVKEKIILIKLHIWHIYEFYKCPFKENGF